MKILKGIELFLPYCEEQQKNKKVLLNEKAWPDRNIFCRDADLHLVLWQDDSLGNRVRRRVNAPVKF